jgi:hypothetical protein
MISNRSRFLLIVIPLITAAALTVASERSHAAGEAAIDPTCNSSGACIQYNNTGAGQGLVGISSAGYGLYGITTVNSTSYASARSGVVGVDNSTSGAFNAGLLGQSARGTGVEGGTVSGAGVSGVSGSGSGVSGYSTSGFGLNGASGNIGVYGTGSYGMYAVSNSYLGVFGDGLSYGSYGFSAAGYGSTGQSSNGTGVYASTSSGFGLQAHTGSGLGAYITNASGNGLDDTGSYIGIVARATSFPIVATDPTGTDLFYVDGAGNIFYHGTLNTFAVTRGGNVASAYGTNSTSPTVEDTGSGKLINGAATVSLDPAFVQTIDPRTPYHVMLTPDGDTRGLFVASKGPSAFVVREVQGGRGSLTFDYHIYATPFGHARQRMSVMTRAEAAAMLPRAPVVSRRPGPSTPVPPVRLPRPVMH